jgi:hypothetical protein
LFLSSNPLAKCLTVGTPLAPVHALRFFGQENIMNSVIYLVGLVVVVAAVLSFVF